MQTLVGHPASDDPCGLPAHVSPYMPKVEVGGGAADRDAHAMLAAVLHQQQLLQLQMNQFVLMQEQHNSRTANALAALSDKVALLAEREPVMSGSEGWATARPSTGGVPPSGAGAAPSPEEAHAGAPLQNTVAASGEGAVEVAPRTLDYSVDSSALEAAAAAAAEDVEGRAACGQSPATSRASSVQHVGAYRTAAASTPLAARAPSQPSEAGDPEDVASLRSSHDSLSFRRAPLGRASRSSTPRRSEAASSVPPAPLTVQELSSVSAGTRESTQSSRLSGSSVSAGYALAASPSNASARSGAEAQLSSRLAALSKPDRPAKPPVRSAAAWEELDPSAILANSTPAADLLDSLPDFPGYDLQADSDFSPDTREFLDKMKLLDRP
eukprot:TRINITY_DN6589_c0_g1_i1.p1 TRINITY_DN6589_c0_g1~~TRINITY_DN6589_c0_g1_i1.p1  ORF type:complete len:383 (+),score=108.97 TRINITY_DN6589_c0_g1_i1:47-1195(+)